MAVQRTREGQEGALSNAADGMMGHRNTFSLLCEPPDGMVTVFDDWYDLFPIEDRRPAGQHGRSIYKRPSRPAWPVLPEIELSPCQASISGNTSNRAFALTCSPRNMVRSTHWNKVHNDISLSTFACPVDATTGRDDSVV